MAQVVLSTDGSTTPTLDTDTQLGSDITAAGIYVLEVDADNLVDGETLLLIFKDKVRSSSSHKEVDRMPVAKHTQGPALLVKFGPYEILHSGQFFLRQEGGTARAFEWSIRKFDSA